ncbi:hypothetical protein XPN_3437 [Xanthomonas arboricola pv. pruni MAFF 301427]|nr:hypothetical protein XPN_3437 [Xanthomonas arboricola pv. pruni MAFF 301427]
MHLSVPLPHRRPLALALALCIATPALAQQQPGAEAVELDAVNVRGERADASTALTGFGATRLLDAPASIAVIERQQLLDRQARVLSEVLRADASTGDAYAPIGYYENFVVRGYSLNAANSYRINGLSAVGEQSIALENKQQVQILKGLAGLQSGVNEPAGLIDYRTKRPEHVRSVTLGTDEQGSRYVAADLGDWFGAERSLGLRVNAAREDINSYVDRADGYRNFLSLAGDWKISRNRCCSWMWSISIGSNARCRVINSWAAPRYRATSMCIACSATSRGRGRWRWIRSMRSCATPTNSTTTGAPPLKRHAAAR